MRKALVGIGVLSLLVPFAVSASVPDITGSLDYMLGAYSSQINVGYSTAPFRQYGVGYRPGASHNICTVDIYGSQNGQPTGGLNLTLRQGTTTTSTTDLSTVGSLVQHADTSYVITTNTTYRYTFTPCAVVVGGTDYAFVFTQEGTLNTASSSQLDNSRLNGSFNYISLGGVIQASGAMGASTATWYILQNNNGVITPKAISDGLVSTDGFDFVINGTENYSAFVASSTTSYSSQNCTPPSSILDVGGGVSYALCFMFVPNTAMIDQYKNLSTLMGTKIPFSYVTNISDAVNNITLNATSSLPLFDIPLSTVASSTLTGVIPDLVVSTTTISRYFTDSIRLPLKALLTAVIWLGAGWTVFGMAMGAFRP